MDIQLNFINRSNDQNRSEVLIFAKNEASTIDELHVAWTVIKNCGQGCNHPFVYSINNSVNASDSWGNFTPQLPASAGERFEMVLTPSGDQLRSAGTANNPQEIQVLNNLQQGAISANIYKSGRLFATKTGLAPQQEAVFQFKPTIWIGVVSQVEQGQIINSAIISEVNTELSLLGIQSADIVMTGGGSGAEAKPFSFYFENLRCA